MINLQDMQDMQDMLTRMRNAHQQRAHTLQGIADEARDRQAASDHEFMLHQLRPAQPWEYAEWLKGYLQAGGMLTHFYDYPTTNFYVAVTHLEVRPLYGALSMEIIVPLGIRDDGGDTGHTSLFITRKPLFSAILEKRSRLEYVQRGFHDHVAGAPTFVPVYSDTGIL